MSQPEVGSLNHYLLYSGGFVNNLLRVAKTADEENKNRLRRAFPQVVAAFEMRNWDEAPPDYPPEYNAVEGDPDRERWIAKAVEEYHNPLTGGDGSIDFDDNAAVSRSKEGAYVAAWVWVSRETIEEDHPVVCERCSQKGHRLEECTLRMVANDSKE